MGITRQNTLATFFQRVTWKWMAASIGIGLSILNGSHVLLVSRLSGAEQRPFPIDVILLDVLAAALLLFGTATAVAILIRQSRKNRQRFQGNNDQRL